MGKQNVGATLVRGLRKVLGTDRIEASWRAEFAAQAYRVSAERGLRVCWTVLVINLMLFPLIDWVTWRNGQWAGQPAHEHIFWWRVGLMLLVAMLLAARALIKDEFERNRVFAWGSAIGFPMMGTWFTIVCQTLITDASIYALFLIGASVLIGQLTAGQVVKIIKDLGLAAISLFGLFIAIFIGIGRVSKEVERRSIYALLAKPISRPQFIAGKYAGLVLTLAVNVTVMTVALYAVLGYLTWIETPEFKASWEAPGVDPAMLKAILLIFVELMLVTAIALFFSTFSSPILSAALTLGLPLSAAGDTIIPLDVNISFSDLPGLVDVAQRIVTRNMVAYRLDGTLTVDAAPFGQPSFGPSTWISGESRVIR